MRNDVNGHGNEMSTGRITQLFLQGGYGFIETADGREIHFHGHSVLHNKYRDLEIGDRVQFAVEAGVRGPQASMISIIEHPHTLEWRNIARRQPPPSGGGRGSW